MVSNHEETLDSGHRRTRSRLPLMAMVGGSIWVGIPGAALHAGNLPVPCVAGACGAQAPTFVGQGAASAVQAGNSLTVNQSSASALLNWQSFNIGVGNTVNFKQPDSSSVALNRIFQADPSQISGSLNANGRVYLLNQNGIIFGAGAQVNVGGLVASSLDLSPDALENGIAGAIKAHQNPALQPYVGADGKPLASGPVTVEAGAQINSPQGQVFLFAPTVTNSGTINTPDGQTILAAGQRVFLAASSDPNLRGLLVEVGEGGTVTNTGPSGAGTTASIVADRGNVTLAGAVVHQQGSISATTSVRANGSILLQARDTTSAQQRSSETLVAERGGELDIDSGSSTAVTLDTSTNDKTVDQNVQPQSYVNLSGKSINIASGAVVRATAGKITASAAEKTDTTTLSSTPDGSALTISTGATLDVSGASVSLAMDRNSLAVQLRGSELADSPLQQTGALRSQTVYVDVRDYGTRADGTTWIGSPLADLTADVATVSRGVQERNLTGGTIALNSQGAALVGQGATLNVSGGQISWQSGYVRTSNLVGTDGKLYNISTADPNRQYTGIADGVTVSDNRWGVTRQYIVPGTGQGQFQPGYVEGRNAGAVTIDAPEVALDGNIVGKVTRGPLQVRDPRTAFASTGAVIGSLFDVMPQGAALTIGQTPSGNSRDYIVSSVNFASGSVLGGPLTSAPDPESLADLTDVRLRPELFGTDAVQNLTAFANDTVTLGAGNPLTLPAGGSVAFTAGKIAVDSDIVIPSGAVTLNARQSSTTTLPDVTVAPGVSIRVEGGWVNDNPALGTGPTAPLFINGGSVSVSAVNGSVTLGDGGVIDVSGGGHLTSGGTVVAGAAGSISVTNSSSGVEPTNLTLGKELRGFGLSTGGSVSISANSVCIAEATCSTAENQLQLTPDWFNSGGFARIAVSSNLGSLEVLDGTTLELQQKNFVLSSSALTAPTGSAMGSISTLQELPDYARKPVNLTLNASYVGSAFVPDGALNVDPGVQIIGDPLSSISLVSNLRILMDGTIVAPGGNISLTLNATSARGASYNADQAIWLGPTARLDASGTVVYQPNVTQTLSGTVLGGGTVQLTALRGYVLTDPASVIDVSGTAAPIDIKTAAGTYERQQVGSNGGSIGFQAYQGMQLNGQLVAQGGGTSGAMGGSLTVSLDPSAANDTRLSGYPAGDHTLVIASDLAPILVGEGTPVPVELQRTGRIAAALINQGGFDQVTLSARNQSFVDPIDGTTSLEGYGTLKFESGVSLQPAARLALDAPVIAVAGGNVDLRASYVSLGTNASAENLLSQNVPLAEGGAGQLSVTANLVDLIGNVAISGASKVFLNSAGDIRAQGVFSQSARSYQGGLSVSGMLDMTAQQIYPTTLSNYSLNAIGDDGIILTHSAAGTPSDVLSAGGNLTLKASEIDIGSTLRAPLGVLLLDADTINAAAGSVLSTSLNGQTVPFGQTQGGLDWTFPLPSPSGELVYNASGVPLPSQNIILQGTNINLAAGSTVDVSGGGDLLASEFVSGPGGTKDLLASTVANQFAVIPGLKGNFAPFDPLISSGSGILPGQQIYLAGGGGLAAGYYTVLPAAYALLPGSFLVKSVAGYQDLPAGQAVSALDGGTVVSGRLGIAGTSFQASRSSGYEILKGSTQSSSGVVTPIFGQYTVNLANSFFTAAATASGATSAPLLPRDAGAVSVIARSTFALDATLQAAVGTGGRGAALQLASSKLLITDDPSQTQAGFVAITPGQIEAFGAQTVIIGGERTNTAAGVAIDVKATDVEVAAGTQLSGPDLILVAQNLLKLDDGSKVSASGTLAAGATDKALELDAFSSLLRVSVGPQVSITRSTAGSGQGLVQFAPSANVASTGSATLDVGVNADATNTFDVAGSLSLAAAQIAIGEAPADFRGVVLDPTRAGGMSVGELILNGRNSIDLYAGATFSGTSLTLQTPVLRTALDTDGVTATLAADSITLAGAVTTNTPITVAGSNGVLNLSAREIDASGPMSILGFTATNLSASEAFHPTDTGTLSVGGDLNLAAGWIAGAAGVNYGIDVQGNATLQALSGNAAPKTGLGGAFALSANSISGDTRIAQPSGQIQLTSLTSDLSLGGASVLSVIGQPQSLGGQTVAAPGGQITLAATHGSVAVAAGSSLDVSASGVGVSAGTVNLSAAEGNVSIAATVNGTGTNGASAGDLNLTARTFDFGSVLSTFSSGGFSGDWNLHLGQGDLSVASGQQLRVSSLVMTADSGAIDVAGVINSDSPRGGYVSLNASGPITVEGTISARGTDANVRGGEVNLSSGSPVTSGSNPPTGSIILASTSRIDVSGTTLQDSALTKGGLVNLRLPQESVQTVLDVDASNDQLVLAAGSAILGARKVTIEGYKAYEAVNGQIDSTNVLNDPSNPWYSDASAFAALAPQVMAALGKSTDASYQVLPGLEVYSQTDLHVAADFNLHNWRFGGLPGVLTLRAAGNLYVDNSINDGFTDSSSFTLPDQPDESWSYRLAAGAQLSSANPLATVQADTAANSSSLLIKEGGLGSVFGAGTPISIRTGNGQIDIATANDLTFGNQASVIYTAGTSGPGIRLADDVSSGALSNLAYPYDGGNIRINAGRDIIGPNSTQLYSEWLWRAGALDNFTPYSTAWTIAFDHFEQGVGALGGGNVMVTAGRDILALSASTPSIGRQVGGTDPASSVVKVTGGGDLTVQAGRNLLGGSYFSDVGVGQIAAGGIIGSSDGEPGPSALAPVLAIGAGSMSVQARQGLAIAAIVNPTLLASATQASSATYLSTYTDDTAVALRTSAGDLDLMGDQLQLTRRFPDYPSFSAVNNAPLSVAPPTVSAFDLSGSIRVAGSMSLWPAPRGNLKLIAADNVQIESVVEPNLQLVVSDAALTSLPTLGAPASTLQSVLNLLSSAATTLPGFHAAQPVHNSAAQGLDPDPILIVANSGDVTFQTGGAGKSGQMFAAKPLDVYAGEDIVNFSALIQNLTPQSVSSLSAGRDFVYLQSRDRNGNVQPNTAGVTVDGPGQLELFVGRTVNLAASSGITTEGNLLNTALGPTGATINVWAGINGQSPDYSAFSTRYLVQSDDYDSLLESYVAQQGVGSPLGKDAALQAFNGFDLPTQRGLYQQILFAELRAGGRSAAAADPKTHNDFTRAFTALNTLLPGSNPDTAAAEKNPYSGDILLYFSRIYTLDGGDINLLAPGGEINVGLAIAPASFGLTKTPAELGLVVQSTGSINAMSYKDFEVNQSRAFAADGGNILVWSTNGNIDAGRGAKTAISAPPPTITIDPTTGAVHVQFPAALSGSGIQTLATSADREPGDVDLFAPRGVVNANDAGIVAGNLTIAATAVLGASNITVSGTSVGVPVDTGGLGAGLVGASNNAAGATNTAAASLGNVGQQKNESPLADSMLGWLDVFVLGFGEDTCKSEDAECLKRQQKAN